MVIKYEYDFILSCKKTSIIDPIKLEQLKKFNVPQTGVTKKQQQLNMKYQSNKWRYNDKEDQFKKKINGVLNKISLDNYEELKNMIQNIGNNININKFDDLEYFVERIINKAIDDPFYSNVYGKLLKDICKLKWFCINTNNIVINSNYISFYELLLFKIKKLYDDIYDGVNTNKQKCINIIQLVNQLYLNNILAHDIYISCIYGLLNNPTELNIELISKMISQCGSKLNDKLTIKYENTIKNIMEKINIIYESITNSRLKYMLLDIIEMYNSGWIIESKNVIANNDNEEKINNILDEYVLNENIEDILYILESYDNKFIINVIESAIKYSFAFNNNKENLLALLTVFIINERKITDNEVINILDNLISNINELIIDSPKCNKIIDNVMGLYITNKIITRQQIKKVLGTKSNEIQELFDSIEFNIVKKKVSPKKYRNQNISKDQVKKKSFANFRKN